MAERYQVEIRLHAEGITPDKISSRDVGELIAAVEQMLAPLVAEDNVALGLDEREVIVGLAFIKRGSYILQFETPHEAEVAHAYQRIAMSIETGHYAGLPGKTVDALKKIRGAARKYRTDVEFWEANGTLQQLATVNTNTQIDVETHRLQGKTTLYGTVVRIGGEDPPRVTLRLLDGRSVTCRVTQRDQFRVARQLGAKLYQTVGVRGTAFWDMQDMKLVDFLVETVLPYTHVPISQALTALHELAGSHFEAIGDAHAFVADLRGTDEDSE